MWISSVIGKISILLLDKAHFSLILSLHPPQSRQHNLMCFRESNEKLLEGMKRDSLHHPQHHWIYCQESHDKSSSSFLLILLPRKGREELFVVIVKKYDEKYWSLILVLRKHLKNIDPIYCLCFFGGRLSTLFLYLPLFGQK